MKEVYKTAEWGKLELDIKVDLITVIEGVRKGANIELWKFKKQDNIYFQEQQDNLEKMLTKSGLEYREHEEYYYINREIALINKLWAGELKIGEFLEYPKCCILNFEEACKEYLKSRGKGPMREFGEAARKAIQEGRYNADLDYVLHAPCSVNCTESIDLARKTKKSLMLIDKNAAEYQKKRVRLFIDYD